MTGRRDGLPASAVQAAAAAETGLTGRFDPHVPGIRYGVLDELVGYSVRRAQIAIYEDFIKALAPWSFTPQRFSALTISSLNPRLELTHLADILGIARSGAVTLVDALADMGYVERHPSPGDRRAYSLAMTERGACELAGSRPPCVSTTRAWRSACSRARHGA